MTEHSKKPPPKKPPQTRAEILAAAIAEAQGHAQAQARAAARAGFQAQPRSRPRRPPFHDFHVEATAFLHEIVMAADALQEARGYDGEPALHLAARWRLVRAIERCGGAPTFSDLGRLLGVSRQAARELALKAAKAGLVELFTAVDDRRAWQVMLTPAGRKALEARRMPQLVWIATLLNGLEPAAMRQTNHVLHVIRLRLERHEKDVSAASARR